MPVEVILEKIPHFERGRKYFTFRAKVGLFESADFDNPDNREAWVNEHKGAFETLGNRPTEIPNNSWTKKRILEWIDEYFQ